MSTDTASQNRRVIDDERLIDVVTERAHAGAVDGAEGGVAPPEIVDALEGEFHRSSIAKRARDLAENGRLKAVWGIGPQGPRRSFLPVEREIRTDGGVPECDRHGCEELAHPGLAYCSIAHARGVSR